MCLITSGPTTFLTPLSGLSHDGCYVSLLVTEFIKCSPVQPSAAVQPSLAQILTVATDEATHLFIYTLTICRPSVVLMLHYSDHSSGRLIERALKYNEIYVALIMIAAHYKKKKKLFQDKYFFCLLVDITYWGPLRLVMLANLV